MSRSADLLSPLNRVDGMGCGVLWYPCLFLWDVLPQSLFLVLEIASEMIEDEPFHSITTLEIRYRSMRVYS